MKARLEAGETLEAYFQQTQIIEERITQNIFVETEGGDPNNVIVVCPFYVASSKIDCMH